MPGDMPCVEQYVWAHKNELETRGDVSSNRDMTLTHYQEDVEGKEGGGLHQKIGTSTSVIRDVGVPCKYCGSLTHVHAHCSMKSWCVSRPTPP